MKRLTIVWFGLVSIGVIQCEKPNTPPAPDPVQAGKSKIFLNGELTTYVPDISSIPGTGIIVYTFEQRRGIYLNEINSADLAPLIPGDLTNKFDFQQLHNDDQGNHIYEQFDRENAYFKVESLDTYTKTVKGKFGAKFKRKLSGVENPDSYLPDTLNFQGIFDTTYREY